MTQQFNEARSDYNCSSSELIGKRGVTIWGPVDIQLDPNEEIALGFTGTKPLCYQSTSDERNSADVINVTYTIHTTADKTAYPNMAVGPIRFEIYYNDYENPNNSRWIFQGNRFHSRIAEHDTRETIDISQSSFKDGENLIYNIQDDTKLNQIKFINQDTQVTVYLNDLRIVRVYGMCDVDKEFCGCCNDSNNFDWSCGETETEWQQWCCDNLPQEKCNVGDVAPCSSEENVSGTGNLDYSRKDYPCNARTCSKHLSYTSFGYDDTIKVIEPDDTVRWTWQNPEDQNGGYVGPHTCFFNFNNVTLSEMEMFNDDVEIRVKVNSSEWVSFYHTADALHLSHGIDLANHEYLSQYYNDQPNAYNNLSLYLDAYTWPSLVLCDGCNDPENYPCPEDCQGGKVNIYRIYETENKCIDDFNDNNINPWAWNTAEVNGGTAFEALSQLWVNVPRGFEGIVGGAGYVSTAKHNLLQNYGEGLEVTIDVTNNHLTYMSLVVSNEKKTDSLMHNLNNFYYIQKAQYWGNYKYNVGNKINGNSSKKASGEWAGPTGELKIIASTGSIAFYENGNLRYAEPFALPDSICNIYAFGSNFKWWNGYGAFDNYIAATPSSSRMFLDTFDDCIYDDFWTCDLGSWTAQNHALISTADNSHIHLEKDVSPNRHVKTNIQTLSSGENDWDVSWLMVKEYNGENRIYALLKNDGVVELSCIYENNKHIYQAQTPYIPILEKEIAVSLIGDNAKVWMNGTLYIDQTDSYITAMDTLCAGNPAYVGLYTPCSTGKFDNIVILAEEITDV